MKVRYTRRALWQMADILDYLEARSPQSADKVSRRLQAVIHLLADHPEAGRATDRGNLRRVVASPYPYVIFYRSDRTGIVIHGVRHAARRPR